MQFPMRDTAGHIKAAVAGSSTASAAPSLITAAGTGDATKVTGETIDRKGSSGSMAQSGVLVIPWQAALTNTKTFALAVELQESADGSSWDTAEVVQASTVVKTAGSTATFHGVAEYSILLSSRKRYIRFNITPDLNASGTDTAVYGAAFVLGGYPISGDAV